MWIRTKDGWYVHELRGACFVTWVSEADKAQAAIFPDDKLIQFLRLIEDWTRKELEAVEPTIMPS